MSLFRRRDTAEREREAALEDAEHEQIKARLDETEQAVVDLAVRVVRLEAEVDIYRPFFVNEKGSE